MNDNNNSSADENIINAGEDGNDLNSNDDDASSPHPETDITDEYPALELGFTAETMTEIRNQWYRFNSVFLNHKEVSTLAVDKRQGLWKSICARVKVKNIKEFRANTLCKAHLFVVKNKVKSLCLTHTCSDDLVGRKRAYKFSQREATSEELRKIPKTSSSKSRREAAHQYREKSKEEGFKLTEKQALKAVVRKSQEPIHVQIGEFFFLPSLFDAWKRADPDGTYCLDTITSHWKPGVEQFQRYYIAPSFSKHAWKHSKVKVFMSDASETATNWTSFNMSMMLATTLDGNNELVVLAIGLCDDCSELTWIWFLQNLMRDFKNIQVFLSNTDLITEGSNVPALLQLMNSVPSLCVTSLVNTLEHLHSTEFRDEEKELIEKMVKATTTQEYDVLRRALASHDRDAALWLDEHKKGFATFNFLGLPNCSRFGNVVSCANAMLNSTIQEVKDQPVSSMTTSLLMNISEAHFDRLKKARQRLEDGKQMTEYAEEKFNKIRDDGKTCRVQVIEHQGSDLWKAIVSQPHGEIIPFPTVIVKINTTLFTCECTCRLYDEMGILCVHGVAFLLQQNYDPEDLQWFHPRYHCQTLVEMYDSEPPDFSVFGKLAVEELLPPEHKLIGERKQRRKTPIVAPNNPHKCSACGEIGHHPKTCFNPSTQYRYQNFSEKSRKWAESACDLKVDGLFKT